MCEQIAIGAIAYFSLPKIQQPNKTRMIILAHRNSSFRKYISANQMLYSYILFE